MYKVMLKIIKVFECWVYLLFFFNKIVVFLVFMLLMKLVFEKFELYILVILS